LAVLQGKQTTLELLSFMTSCKLCIYRHFSLQVFVQHISDFINNIRYINHDKEDLPFQQKEQLLKEKGLQTSYFLQESDLLSGRLLDALRICLMKDLEVFLVANRKFKMNNGALTAS
jgi:hypothetical protein